MFKVRMNLRRVAAIVACLAVTTMFTACDNGDDDDGGGGNTDTKLVGNWVYTTTSGNTYYYQFANDGSFYYYQRMGSTVNGVTGKYTASNGNIALTNLETDWGTKLKDPKLKYTFGTDANGEYLSIHLFQFLNADSDDEPEPYQPMKFRRSN
jgi:hypothetical protein